MHVFCRSRRYQNAALRPRAVRRCRHHIKASRERGEEGWSCPCSHAGSAHQMSGSEAPVGARTTCCIIRKFADSSEPFSNVFPNVVAACTAAGSFWALPMARHASEGRAQLRQLWSGFASRSRSSLMLGRSGPALVANIRRQHEIASSGRVRGCPSPTLLAARPAPWPPVSFRGHAEGREDEVRRANILRTDVARGLEECMRAGGDSRPCWPGRTRRALWADAAACTVRTSWTRWTRWTRWAG